MQINLTFDGGLNTGMHESKIGDSDAADIENASIRGGTVRLDQRYIKVCEPSGHLAQGSGWGQFGSGAQSEQYAAVISGAMQLVDLTASTLAFTPVVNGAGLASGDWWFQQFEGYLYAANLTAGMGRKLLGAGTDGTGNWGLLRLPGTPTAAPGAALHQPPYVQESFVGSSVAHSPALGVGESCTYEAAGDRYHLVYNSAGQHTFTVTFAAGVRPNWEHRDILRFMLLMSGLTQPPAITVNQGGLATDAMLWYIDQYYIPSYRMQNIARSSRTAVTSLTFTFTTVANRVDIYLPSPQAWGVWLSLDSATNPGTGLPALVELDYEYTYYNRSSGFESAPSPAAVVPAAQQLSYGEWRDLTAPVSTGSGITHVRFYRRVNEGGSPVRYRLAEVDNSGTPSYTDKLTLNEVQALPVFVPSVLPITGVTAIAAWENRMVLGVGALCYISRDGNPLAYEDFDAAFDEFDPGRGLTFYPDDKRSESILGICGQDDLYIITRYSVRAVIGNSPDNWRLIKLPDSEGAVGPRTWAPYKKGVLVLTPSGRLLYHHSLLPEPMEVGERLRARPGATGLKGWATSDSTLSVRPDGQIEVRTYNGAYLVLDTNGQWRKGTHPDGTHSTLFVAGLPIRWIGSSGVLFEGGSDTYKTDGGLTGSGGAPAIWSISSKKYLLPRAGVSSVFWGDTSEHAGQYPKLVIVTTRGTKIYTKQSGRRNLPIPITNAGEAVQFKIIGDKDTVVEECRIDLEILSPARNK